jgi:hypothetical protein
VTFPNAGPAEILESRFYTAMAALLMLCAPRQLPRVGVIVYCQLPLGTLSSVQVRAATVPEQFAATVASAPVAAL